MRRTLSGFFEPDITHSDLMVVSGAVQRFSAEYYVTIMLRISGVQPPAITLFSSYFVRLDDIVTVLYDHRVGIMLADLMGIPDMEIAA